MLGVEVARISNIKKNGVWTNSSRSFVNMKVQPDSHLFFFLPFAPRLGCESGSILGVCSAYKIPVIKDLTRVLDEFSYGGDWFAGFGSLHANKGGVTGKPHALYLGPSPIISRALYRVRGLISRCINS